MTEESTLATTPHRLGHWEERRRVLPLYAVDLALFALWRAVTSFVASRAGGRDEVMGFVRQVVPPRNREVLVWDETPAEHHMRLQLLAAERYRHGGPVDGGAVMLTRSGVAQALAELQDAGIIGIIPTLGITGIEADPND
jgi:hypothetical protein